MANDKLWNKVAADMLVGRTVKAAFYMLGEEAGNCGFNSRPLVIIFDNGLCIYPMSDDEGNDAGALATTDSKTAILPVL